MLNATKKFLSEIVALDQKMQNRSAKDPVKFIDHLENSLQNPEWGDMIAEREDIAANRKEVEQYVAGLLGFM